MAATLSTRHSDGSGTIVIDPANIAGTRSAPTSSDPVTSYLLGLRNAGLRTVWSAPALNGYLDTLFAGRATNVSGEVLSSGIVTDVAESKFPLDVSADVYDHARTL